MVLVLAEYFKPFNLMTNTRSSSIVIGSIECLVVKCFGKLKPPQYFFSCDIVVAVCNVTVVFVFQGRSDFISWNLYFIIYNERFTPEAFLSNGKLYKCMCLVTVCCPICIHAYVIIIM